MTSILDTSLIAYQENGPSYNSDFIEHIRTSLDSDLIYLFEVFDEQFIDQLEEIVVTYPLINFIFVEENPIQDSKDRLFLLLEKLKKHSNITYRFLFSKLSDQSYFNLCVNFPFRKMKVVFGKNKSAYQFKKIQKIFSKLENLNYLHSMNYYELLGQELIFENFINNIPEISKSLFLEDTKNIYRGLPALILGAGPSLDEATNHFVEIRKKMVVFSAGTSVSILSSKNLKPHFFVATCPRPTEVAALEENKFFDVPLIYTSRLNHCCLSFFGPQKIFFHNLDGGFDFLIESEFKAKIDSYTKMNPSTVAGVAILAALQMGCNPIILSGIDLSDKKKGTTQEWKQEGKWVEELISMNPHFKLITTSKNGLPIPGIEIQDWKDILRNLLDFPFELDTTLLNLTSRFRNFEIYLDHLKGSLDIVENAAIRVIKYLLEDKLKETDFRVVILLDEIENEISYKKVFKKKVDYLMALRNQHVHINEEDSNRDLLLDRMKLVSDLAKGYLRIIKEKKYACSNMAESSQ